MNTQQITQLFKDFLQAVEEVTPPIVVKELLSEKADELADKITHFGFEVFNESQNQTAKIASLELKIKSLKEDINFLQEKNREAVEKIGELSGNMTTKLALFHLRVAMKNKGFDEIDFDADGDNSYQTYKIESYDGENEFTFRTLHDLAKFLNS